MRKHADKTLEAVKSATKPGLGAKIRTAAVYSSLLGSYVAGFAVSKLNHSDDEGRRFMLNLFSELSFALIGLKINVKHPEKMLKAQPAVVIFNHQSQADGLIIMKMFRDNFAAVGKKEIGKFKPLAKAYEFAGIIPIDRANTQSAIEAMKPLVDALAVEKRNVAIAPEGTRSPTAKPLPFKKGPFHVAMQAGVPILPVVLHDTAKIQPKGQFAYSSGEVEVEVLEPISTEDWTVDALDIHIAEVRNMYLSKLGFDEEPLPEPKSSTAGKSAKAKR